MKLDMQVGLGPGHIVLDGYPAPPPPKGHRPPIFAGWIKIPLGMEVDLGQGDFVLEGDPAHLPKKEAEPLSPIFGPCTLRPNALMDQYGTWHGGGPWCRPHCVRWGPSLPPQKGRSPQFSFHVYCGQTAAWIKMPLGMEVGLGPDDNVLDGDPAPLSPKAEQSPSQFSFHVCFGRTAGWINMALDMEVGLGRLVQATLC